MKTKKWLTPLIFAASGFLTALPVVITSLAPLGWLSFAPAAYLLLTADFTLTRKSLAAAYLYGLCFFEAFGLVIFNWFCSLYPLDFVDGMSPAGAVAVVAAGWVGLSLLQAVVAAVQFLIFAVLKAAATKKNLRLTPVMIALLPSLYICFEWIQTQTWAGVPWSKLALGQTKFLALIQSASLFGSYFVDFLLILTGTLAAAAFIALKDKRIRRACAVIGMAAAIFSANAVFGALKISLDSALDVKEPVTVAVLQGNISSADKWESSKLAYILEIYSELSKQASIGVDLVVWPETAIPYTITQLHDLSETVSELVAECSTQMLIGAFTQADELDEGDKEYKAYTSTMFYKADGEYTGLAYSKRHLVPFGEYLPWADFFRFIYPPLTDLTMFDNPLSHGSETAVFDTDAGKVGSLICFDSIYETLAIDSVRDGAEILAISTNDSWFSDSSAVWQHNCHAALRAVETGRWVVRAANTGVSSVISPLGETVEMLEPLIEGYINAQVVPRDNLTLYTIIGNTFVAVCAAFCLGTPVFIVGIRGRTSKRR